MSELKLQELQLLIFTIMGVKFGLDMALIKEMCEIPQAQKRQIDLIHIPEKISFPTSVIQYQAPKALIIGEPAAAFALVIDQPEAFQLTVKIHDILPQPELLRRLDRSAPIWGVIVPDQEIVLLLDPFKLRTDSA